MSLEFKSKIEVTTTRMDINNQNNDNNRGTGIVLNTYGLPHVVLAKKTSEPYDRVETLEIKAVGSTAEGVTYWVTKTDHIGDSRLATPFICKLNNKSVAEHADMSDTNLGEMMLDKAFTALIQPMNTNPFYRNKFNHSVAQWMIDNALIKTAKEIKVPGIDARMNGVNTFQAIPQYGFDGIEVERFYRVEKGMLSIVKTITKRPIDRFTRETKLVLDADHHDLGGDIYHGMNGINPMAGGTMLFGGGFFNQPHTMGNPIQQQMGMPMMAGYQQQRGFSQQPYLSAGNQIQPMQHGIPTQPLFGNGNVQTGYNAFSDNKTITENKIQHWVDALKRVVSGSALFNEADKDIDGFFDNISTAFLGDNFIATIATTPSEELSTVMKCELISVYLRSPGVAMAESKSQQEQSTFNSHLQREFNTQGYQQGYSVADHAPASHAFGYPHPLGYIPGYAPNTNNGTEVNF